MSGGDTVTRRIAKLRLSPLTILTAATALVLVLSVAAVGKHVATVPAPRRIDVVVSPHPDDEMEAWALVEDEPEAFHVFVYATLGEATGFCDPDLPGYQEGTGEASPRPNPEGKYSGTCEEARIGSTLAFLDAMAQTDAGLPDRLAASTVRVVGPFPDRGVSIRRIDGEGTAVSDRSARVYDGGERGLVVFWNLGDGDLTPDEVTWVVDTVVEHRSELGIPDLPWGRLVGASFFHDGSFDDCMTYDHPDHGAVREALSTRAFAAFYRQFVPTCRTDPEVAFERTTAHFEDAFRLGGPAPDGFHMRSGAHNVHYGWLYTPYYAGDRIGQGAQGGELFHRHQFFRARSGVADAQG